jgi:hypothetical protein
MTKTKTQGISGTLLLAVLLFSSKALADVEHHIKLK